MAPSAGGAGIAFFPSTPGRRRRSRHEDLRPSRRAPGKAQRTWQPRDLQVLFEQQSLNALPGGSDRQDRGAYLAGELAVGSHQGAPGGSHGWAMRWFRGRYVAPVSDAVLRTFRARARRVDLEPQLICGFVSLSLLASFARTGLFIDWGARAGTIAARCRCRPQAAHAAGLAYDLWVAGLPRGQG